MNVVFCTPSVCVNVCVCVAEVKQKHKLFFSKNKIYQIGITEESNCAEFRVNLKRQLMTQNPLPNDFDSVACSAALVCVHVCVFGSNGNDSAATLQEAITEFSYVARK